MAFSKIIKKSYVFGQIDKSISRKKKLSNGLSINDVTTDFIFSDPPPPPLVTYFHNNMPTRAPM